MRALMSAQRPALRKISERKWNSNEQPRKIFGGGGPTQRESLALIRSILIDSGCP